MIKVSPSILSADFANLGEEARKMQQAGAPWLHQMGYGIGNNLFDICQITDVK